MTKAVVYHRVRIMDWLVCDRTPSAAGAAFRLPWRELCRSWPRRHYGYQFVLRYKVKVARKDRSDVLQLPAESLPGRRCPIASCSVKDECKDRRTVRRSDQSLLLPIRVAFRP